MVKKVSKEQQVQILEAFLSGRKIKEIAKDFNFTEPTITRQLKNLTGEETFLKVKKSKTNDLGIEKKIYLAENIREDNNQKDKLNNQINESDSNLRNKNIYSQPDNFFEITPLTEGIELEIQQDFSSVSLNEVEFPKILYMIVNEKIELETKFLKEYPQWQFLSSIELNRKTIQIFYDIKMAKRSCDKKQKVIKIPNTDVFRIVAPLLKARGISRLISEEKLIAL